MKILDLKNYFFLNMPNDNKSLAIISLQDWLNNLVLSGEFSRARTRFIKLVLERAKEVEEERMRLAEDNAKRIKGEIVYLKKDGKETMKKAEAESIAIKDPKKLNDEYSKYLNESLIIEVGPALEGMIDIVKSVILNTKEEFVGSQAMRFNEWCESFENIKENEVAK